MTRLHQVLHGTKLTVVTAGAAAIGTIVETLRNAGAMVELRASGADLFVGAEPPDLWLVADATPLSPMAVRHALLAHEPEAPVTLLCSAADVTATAAPDTTVSHLDPALAAPALVEAVQVLSAPRRRIRALEESLARFHEEARGRRAAFQTVHVGLERLAHDLRTPLHAALGFAANLRDGVDGPVNDAQVRSAERIAQAITGAEAILEELHAKMFAAMDLAGPERSGSVQPRERPGRTVVALSDVATETVSLLGDEARRRGITLVAEVSQSIMVWGSEAQLRQLLANLVSNALKFTPEGGQVTVRLSLTTPDGSEGRRRAELVVEDTGPGVPATERERIFERGVRLPRDAGVPGGGVGLSVCRDVVARHGGNIRVDDRVGGGARFVARLPQDRRARPAAGVLVLREESATEALLDALLTDGPEDLAAVSPEESLAFLNAARASRAIVVVPREGSDDALDRAVQRLRGPGGKKDR